MHVIDASVVLKWVVEEENSGLARSWAARPLVAPDLIRLEVGNALWKKSKQGEISAEQALLALTYAVTHVTLVRAEPLTEQALGIGLELGHPIYDCLYLALAERMQAPLLTADRRFIRACSGSRYAPLLHSLEQGTP